MPIDSFALLGIKFYHNEILCGVLVDFTDINTIKKLGLAWGIVDSRSDNNWRPCEYIQIIQ